MRRHLMIVAALALLLFLLPSPALSLQSVQVTIIHFVDGDTLYATSPGSGRFEIRLYGIDCPERNQPYGPQALVLTQRIVRDGQCVGVFYPIDKDRYGRIVGELYLPLNQTLASNNISLNKALILLGAAWWYRTYAPDRSDFGAAELAARSQRLGLWSLPNPVPPWKWRGGSRQ